MDLNNSPQDSSGTNETSSKYQDILDQYSKQVTVTPDTDTEPDNQTVINPDEVLKTIVPETDTILSPPALSSPEITSEPTLTSQPQTFPKITEITPTSNDTQPPVAKQSNFFKILFYISILIFLAVASVLAFSFINDSKTSSNPAIPTSPTVTEPTSTPEAESFCYLNDNKYKLDETFPSADGCNTCSCGPDGTIVCTEKACDK